MSDDALSSFTPFLQRNILNGDIDALARQEKSLLEKLHDTRQRLERTICKTPRHDEEGLVLLRKELQMAQEALSIALGQKAVRH